MRKKAILMGCGIAAVAGTFFSGAGLAIAASADKEIPTNSTEIQLLTAEQVEASWDRVVATYPEALPAGFEFPANAPPFFYPEEKTLFQEGLTETIAGRFWRCAWLDDSINKAADGSLRQAARSADALDNFVDTPNAGVAYDIDTYEEAVQEVASSTDVSPERAEFDMDCGDLVYPRKAE